MCPGMVVVLLNQSNLGCQRRFISLSLVHSFIAVRKHPKRTGLTLCDSYKRKTWVLNICLFDILAYHSQAENRQINTHAGVYRYTVKCALRLHEPRSTLRRVYTTPRGSHLCIVLVQLSIVVVRISKNKASVTPFNM